MISKYTMRLLNDLENNINSDMLYTSDHLVDRIEIMEKEPIFCMVMFRNCGTQFYNLTRDYNMTSEEWNKIIDGYIENFKFWYGDATKVISYCYGYSHTILYRNKDKTVRDIAYDRAILLIESFRGYTS
jgi:hypothetical protein